MNVSDTISIPMNQYNKHLLINLLEDSGIEVLFDETINSNGFSIQTHLISEVPEIKIGWTVLLKDVADCEFCMSMEAALDIQKMINEGYGPFKNNNTLYKIDLELSNNEIILRKNGESIMILPYRVNV